MFTTNQVHTLTTLATALLGPKPPAPAKAAHTIMELLNEDAAARSAVATAQRARHAAAGAGGRPPIEYVVDFDGHWAVTVHGAKAAQQVVAETLTAHGYKYVPTAHSMGVMLSRKGEWGQLLETDHGTWYLSVKRQVPKIATTSDTDEKG